VILALRLQPGARGDIIEGPVTLDDGLRVLKARVRAPADKGRANEALLKLLAKTWRLARRDMEIITGHRDRRKVVLIKGDTLTLMTTLQERLRALECAKT
jgi:uncharacterized protein (TIGR00251 family)